MADSLAKLTEEWGLCGLAVTGAAYKELNSPDCPSFGQIFLLRFPEPIAVAWPWPWRFP